MKVYRIKGANDEVTTCQCCGRQNLKETVILEALDPEGTGTGAVVRFGTSCAARALTWTQKAVKQEVKRVKDAEAAALAAEQQRQFQADYEAYGEFLFKSTGKTIRIEAVEALGGLMAARKAYREYQAGA